MKFKKSSLTKADEISKTKTFKLEKDPLRYFYDSYKNHVYDETMTWGDVFRLHKYFRRFMEWDTKFGTRIFRVYPEKLTKEDIAEAETILFL